MQMLTSNKNKKKKNEYINIFYSVHNETKMTIIPTLGVVHHSDFDYLNFNAPDNGVFACNCALGNCSSNNCLSAYHF